MFTRMLSCPDLIQKEPGITEEEEGSRPNKQTPSIRLFGYIRNLLLKRPAKFGEVITDL